MIVLYALFYFDKHKIEQLICIWDKNKETILKKNYILRFICFKWLRINMGVSIKR